jgi:hypothetical protein
MIFNGHTEQYINSLDEEIFAEIQVMYADGLLGNRAIFDAITPLTTAVFNYIRSPTSPAYKSEQIFPAVVEYSTEPEIENNTNEALLLFMTHAPNFKMDRFVKDDPS